MSVVRRSLLRPYPVTMAAAALLALCLAAYDASIAPYVRSMPVLTLALVQTGVAVRCLVDRRTSVNRRRAQLLSNVSGAAACALVVVILVAVLSDTDMPPGRRLVTWAVAMGGLDVAGALMAVFFDADEGRAP